MATTAADMGLDIIKDTADIIKDTADIIKDTVDTTSRDMADTTRDMETTTKTDGGYGSYGGLGWREGQKPGDTAAPVDPAATGQVTFQ
jgi:hypothetical protein